MRVTPGALWFRTRQTFEHGLRTAWYRDIVRPRILSTKPIQGTKDDRCEIHVLTSKNDWLNLIWALKSFYFMSGRRYKLCIHEDGSVTEEVLRILQNHFPDSRIITKKLADEKITEVLKGFPRSSSFRKVNLLAPKIFDFISFLDSDRMALFDSDLLFFSEPKAFLSRVEDPAYLRNTFNSDVGDAYTVNRTEVGPIIGHPLQPRLNSGFGLVHRASIRWDWTEEFLGLPGILEGHFWRIEQTLYALCSSRFGVELLPEEYTLYFEPGIGNRSFRHYNGAIRHLMYSEGIPSLLKSGVFTV